jgi:carbonic anhydrase
VPLILVLGHERCGAVELLTERQRAGRLKIVGARYDLDHGRVEFFHQA